MGSVQSLWIDATCSSFPLTKLAVTGELPKDLNRPAIIIANHQVDADWWFIWQAASFYHGAGNIKIVLKDQLKYLPVVGWGMRLFDFLFLRRNFEQDAKHIKAYMDSLNKDQFPFWLVFFPEGTTIHTEYVIKANAFAEKTNRPTFQHVVLPRTAGLQVILDAVKDVKPDIYDLTIAYPTYSGEVPTFDMEYDRKLDTGIPSMKTLLANQPLLQPVAIHAQKFTYEEANSDLEKFLDTRWAEKEVRLAHYIKHQSFPVRKTDPKLQIMNISRSITAVFRLWFGVTIAFFLLPFVMFSFFPLYTTWVIYCFIYSIYDRTTRFWWPYIINLILDSANKTRDKISFRK